VQQEGGGLWHHRRVLQLSLLQAWQLLDPVQLLLAWLQAWQQAWQLPGREQLLLALLLVWLLQGLGQQLQASWVATGQGQLHSTASLCRPLIMVLHKDCEAQSMRFPRVSHAAGRPRLKRMARPRALTARSSGAAQAIYERG